LDRFSGNLSYSPVLLIGFHVPLVTLPGLSGKDESGCEVTLISEVVDRVVMAKVHCEY
jgi:hypothetical protein